MTNRLCVAFGRTGCTLGYREGQNINTMTSGTMVVGANGVQISASILGTIKGYVTVGTLDGNNGTTGTKVYETVLEKIYDTITDHEWPEKITL